MESPTHNQRVIGAQLEPPAHPGMIQKAHSCLSPNSAQSVSLQAKEDAKYPSFTYLAGTAASSLEVAKPPKSLSKGLSF